MIFFSSVDATMLPSTNKTQNYYKHPVMAIQNFCSSDLSVYSLLLLIRDNILTVDFLSCEDILTVDSLSCEDIQQLLNSLCCD